MGDIILTRKETRAKFLKALLAERIKPDAQVVDMAMRKADRLGKGAAGGTVAERIGRLVSFYQEIADASKKRNQTFKGRR